MFFLSPLITTFIKGKNIKTMAVSFFVSGLINQFLHRNYCVPTQPVKETIITGILNSLLVAYTMCAIDLGLYYSAFGNLNAVLSPVITYTLGYILRGISPATVYTSSGLILLLPILYIRMRMKKFDKKEVKL